MGGKGGRHFVTCLCFALPTLFFNFELKLQALSNMDILFIKGSVIIMKTHASVDYLVCRMAQYAPPTNTIRVRY